MNFWVVRTPTIPITTVPDPKVAPGTGVSTSPTRVGLLAADAVTGLLINSWVVSSRRHNGIYLLENLPPFR